MTKEKKLNVAVDGQYKHVSYPSTFADSYNDDAIEKTKRIIDWLNKNKHPVSWLFQLEGKTSGRTRIGSLVDGKYPSKVNHHLDNLLNLLSHVDARKHVTDVPFFPDTTVAKTVNHACRLARKRRKFAMVNADVGTGKTRSLREYAKRNANTILIDSGPNMSASAMFDDIIEQCKINVLSYMTLEKKYRACIKHLKDSESLLIIDEAETVSAKMLHYVRRVCDLAGIGVVLAGTPNLDSLINPVGGQFDQIRSRVTYSTKIIRSVTENDARSVLHLAFDDYDIDDTIFKIFWYYCKGSMRVLVEHIIPNVREIGLKKRGGKKIDLTPEVIHEVCKNILNLK